MPHFAGYAVVFVGAGLGGMLRHAANRVMIATSGIPWNTLAVNVTGSLALGLIAGWLAFRGEATQTTTLFLTTGLLGGYTTFSAFSLDVALLWERGQAWHAVLYAGGSVLLSVAATFVGLAVARTA
jgi:CrcB protein